ncbi:hypothetical protein ACLOJK_036579, partial [Asimina triloba]
MPLIVATVSSNVAVEEDDEPTSPTVRTHHHRAPRQAIQAAHHDDDDDEHIPDLSKPQADVDHSGHTRGHVSIFDPIIGDHKGDANHFLLMLHLAVDSSHNRTASLQASARPGSIDLGRLSCCPPAPFAIMDATHLRQQSLPPDDVAVVESACLDFDDRTHARCCPDFDDRTHARCCPDRHRTSHLHQPLPPPARSMPVMPAITARCRCRQHAGMSAWACHVHSKPR